MSDTDPRPDSAEHKIRFVAPDQNPHQVAGYLLQMVEMIATYDGIDAQSYARSHLAYLDEIGWTVLR